MIHRFLLALSATLTSAAAAPPDAAPLLCPGGEVTVEAQDRATATRVCDQIAEIRPALAACGLEQGAPLTVYLVDEAGLPSGPFLGSYAAGSNEIRLTRPDRLPDLFAPGHPFARLDPALMFQSLLVHELSHAFLDQAECSRTRCVAEHEYVAYAMQLSFLPEEARATLLGASERGPGTAPVLQESLNDFTALLDPVHFANRVWRHFSRPENGCDFIRKIQSGEVDLRLPPL